MNKIILTLSLIGLCQFTYAQVGINTSPPHPTAALDMSDSEKGFLAPKIALQNIRDTSTINAPKKGVLVFNTTSNSDLQPGYYYWNNEKWEPFHNNKNEVIQNVSQNVFASSLGYVPSGNYEEALTELNYYGATSLKRTCFQFTDNYAGATEHTYCGYTMEGPVTWEQAFHFSKYLKGYLVTITSTNEWDFIKTNLLDGGEDNADHNTWIGYNRIKTPGNSPEYTWITGEKSVINWSNSSTLQVNYAAGEPDSSGSCVYISDAVTSADRRWYNDACSINSANGVAFDYIIIEFHD